MTDVSRRRIVQGVAWTVPAIAVATAAPAYAVSGGQCLPSEANLSIDTYPSCGTQVAVLDIGFRLNCPCNGPSVISALHAVSASGWRLFSTDTSGPHGRAVYHADLSASEQPGQVVIDLTLRCPDGAGGVTETPYHFDRSIPVPACPA